MPPAIIGAAIGGVATLGAGMMASSAASKASKAQQQSAAEANALQKYMYDQTRTDQAPWRDAGVAALGQLSEFMKPGADLTALLQAQPGYQARFDEGVNAVDRSASANGSLTSGGQQKALTRYGQTFGSNELNNVLNRYASVAGLGQTANQQIGQAGQNYANQAGNNLMDAGQARATGYQNQSGIATQTLGNLAGLGSNMFNQFGSAGIGSPGTWSAPPATVSPYGYGQSADQQYGYSGAGYATSVPGVVPFNPNTNFGGF